MASNLRPLGNETLIASNLRPLRDKTLVASNLWSITVPSNLFYVRFKIITHKMRSFDDVLLFSVKPNMLKIRSTAKRENNYELYLLIAMLKQY
jgi:hypothetical protein